MTALRYLPVFVVQAVLGGAIALTVGESLVGLLGAPPLYLVIVFGVVGLVAYSAGESPPPDAWAGAARCRLRGHFAVVVGLLTRAQ